MLVERLSQAAGRPVVIGRIETGFEGLLPSLTVDGIRIEDADGVLLDIPRAVAVLSPRTLLEAAPRLAALQLDATRVRVERLAGGRALRVAGVDVLLDGSGDGRVAEFVLSQRRILARDVTIDWIDAERGVRDSVTGVDLKLGNVGRRHRVELDAGALADVWRGARLALEFYRAPYAPVADWRRWRGEVFVGAEGLDWAALGRLFPGVSNAWVTGARADVRGWLQFDQGRAHDGLLKLAATEVSMAGRWRSLSPASVEFEATLRQAGEGYDVRVRQVAARLAGGFSVAGGGEQAVTLDAEGRPLSARIAVAAFDVEQALALARRVRLDADAPISGLVQSLKASGRVTSLSAEWRAGSESGYQVNVDFAGLSMRRTASADASLPWFANVDGQARIGDGGGELSLRSRQATLAFPGIFAEPAITLDSLEAEARWRIEASGDPSKTLVNLTGVRFANQDAAGTLSGTYRTGGKGAGIVDLSATLERASAARAYRYLPLVIPVEVRDWIASAVDAGKLSDVKMKLRGDLEDFPYRRESEGEFSVVAQLNDARLAYAPGWPAIERLQGQLLFERAGMTILMRSGRVFDVALGATQARLKDFADPMLRIEGGGDGPVRDMVRFVNESPVATRIDDFTRDMVAVGPSRMKLRLDLPLDDLDRTRVAGSVQFLRNDITIDRTIPPMSGVTGALEFTDEGLALHGIEARFLGGTVHVDGETPEPGHFLIRGRGDIDADGIRSVADNPLTRKLSGSTSYTATIDVHRRASSLTIESDLSGLGAALPAPFEKSATEVWPLRVKTVAVPPPNRDARSPGDTIHVELGSDLRLSFERERDAASHVLKIRRAALGVKTEPRLPARGFAVRLASERIDADRWWPLLAIRDGDAVAGPIANEFTEGFSLAPNLVDLSATEVRIGGKDLHDVRIAATRERDRWQADVASREINGQFGWREAAPGQRQGAITARFSRLEIPKSRATEVESLLDTPPESLPALDVRADELILNEHHLGRLSLRATNGGTAAAPTWTVEELIVDNPSARLKASGLWETHGMTRGSKLDFVLELADSGGLLDTFGMKDLMRAGAGRLSGDLRWSGSPLAIDYPSLSGRLGLKLGKGRFLKADPGIAKLIGVLNLQSLPRRLTLDFSDVFAQGFSFDDIDADAQIERGIARTERFAMNGAGARVKIAGSANIADETQDLVAVVRPELNAGLASLAYGAMVHPAIGLGSFLAQIVLSGPIEDLFAYEFEIKGTWADPQVSEKRRPPPLPSQAEPTAPK